MLKRSRKTNEANVEIKSEYMTVEEIGKVIGRGGVEGIEERDKNIE